MFVKEHGLYNEQFFLGVRYHKTYTQHYRLVAITFPQCDTPKIFIHDPLKAETLEIDIFVRNKCEIYEYGNFSIGSKLPIGAIQVSSQGCGWFTLEGMFRLSSINLFEVLERNKKKFRYNHDEKTFILAPQKVPPEMASIFISCQSNTLTYQHLSKNLKSFIVSKKGLSLHELIQHRHTHGLLQFCDEPEIAALLPHRTFTWPNNYHKSDIDYKNWNIVYFKVRQLLKMIDWLKEPVNQDLLVRMMSSSDNISRWMSELLRICPVKVVLK